MFKIPELEEAFAVSFSFSSSTTLIKRRHEIHIRSLVANIAVN